MISRAQTDWEAIGQGCRRIRQYSEGLDQAALTRDGMALDALRFNLEWIHAHAASLPREAHPRLPEEKWRWMESFRDVAVEARHGQPNDTLWEAVRYQVPKLLQAWEAAGEGGQIPDPASQSHHRGREAVRPDQIPRSGWRDILLRVYDRIWTDNLFLVSAGVGFYALLAIFPALAALISVYGLLFDPADVTEQLELIGGVLPADAWNLLREQLQSLTSRSATALSIGVVVSLGLALWSARAGVGGLIVALNIVYREREKRSLLTFYLTALLLTLGAILFAVSAVALVVALPALLGRLGLQDQTQALVAWLRWPGLAIGVMVALAVVYRFGPSRRLPRWGWVNVGSVVATLLWLAGSALFSFYVANFGAYNETYGSVGAVIILMLWFWLTAFIVLLGGLFNAEMEHQTRRDTTVAPNRPLGKRGAYVADTLGRKP